MNTKTELRTISLMATRFTFPEAYAEVTRQYHAELGKLFTGKPLVIALSQGNGYIRGSGYFASVLASVQFEVDEENAPTA